MTISSYNRIPKTMIKKTNQHVYFSGEMVAGADDFKKTVLEKEIEEAIKQIKEKRQGIIAEMEAGKQKAVLEGYEEGKKTALAEAEESLRAEYAHLLEKANAVYLQANDYYKNIIDESELIRGQYITEKRAEIIDFAISVAKEITKADITADNEKMEQIFEENIKKIKYDTEKIYVRVHPKTKNILENKKAEINGRIEFRVDMGMELTDMIIETDRECVDASIENQMEIMREYLRGVLNAGFE